MLAHLPHGGLQLGGGAAGPVREALQLGRGQDKESFFPAGEESVALLPEGATEEVGGLAGQQLGAGDPPGQAPYLGLLLPATSKLIFH